MALTDAQKIKAVETYLSWPMVTDADRQVILQNIWEVVVNNTYPDKL